jgi:hypothetical protein
LRVAGAVRESSGETGACVNGRLSFPGWDGRWRGTGSGPPPGGVAWAGPSSVARRVGVHPSGGEPTSPAPDTHRGADPDVGNTPSSQCQRIYPAIHRECGRNGRVGARDAATAGVSPGTVGDRCRPGPARAGSGSAHRCVPRSGVVLGGARARAVSRELPWSSWRNPCNHRHVGRNRPMTVAGARFSGATRSDTGGRSGYGRDGALDDVVGVGVGVEFELRDRRLAGRSGRGRMRSTCAGRGAAGAAGCFT